MNARALPVNAVVATEDRVWIKRSNARTNPAGSPFHETWWIEATTFAIQVDDLAIQRLLNSGDAQVLRPGDAS